MIFNDFSKHLSDYQAFLPQNYNFILKDTVSSTNDLLKSAAQNGAPEGTVMIARAQTCGKGRMGRSFYSPDRTGLYMSILLRPQCSPSDCLMITPLAAVGVAKALENIGSPKIELKWVNDIFINGRKVGGILTESSFSSNRQRLDYVILGIGINLTPPDHDFPEDIKSIAGSVFDNRSAISSSFYRLSAMIVGEVFRLYTALPSRDFMTEYKMRSIILGKNVKISFGGAEIEGLAEDIDDSGNLILRLPDDQKRSFSFGEARIILK